MKQFLISLMDVDLSASKFPACKMGDQKWE